LARASIEPAFAVITRTIGKQQLNTTKRKMYSTSKNHDHKNLDTTSMYIQIAENLFQHEPDAFTVNVARTQEEITAHLEVGFEWIGEKDGLVYLRKRK
jgi:hypothetical protein